MRVPADKRAHAEVSAGLTFALGFVALTAGRPLWWAPAIVLVLGGLRELAQLVTARWPLARAWADVWRVTRWAMIGNAEWGDMGWNCAGAGGAYIGLLLLAVAL